MVSMSYSLWRGELGIRWQGQGQGQGQDFPPHHNFGVEEMMTMIKIDNVWFLQGLDENDAYTI
jgi:hypothetical protein